MANKIQFKRGLKSNLPVLSVGEPALTIDTKEVFIGNGTSNTQIATTANPAFTGTPTAPTMTFSGDINVGGKVNIASKYSIGFNNTTNCLEFNFLG